MSAAAFLRAIWDHPNDDGPRLVYADWLDEQGDPRGEFIRLQCELARLDESDPRRWPLEGRERFLLSQYGKGWAGPLRRFARSWRFRRGFVEDVTLPLAEFLRHGGDLFALAPVRRLRATQVGGVLRDLARSQHLDHLTGLDLSGEVFPLDDLAYLLHSPRLGALKGLGLRGTPLCSAPGMYLLGAASGLAGLEELDLSHFREPADAPRGVAEPIPEAAVRGLLESPYLRHIRRLGLAGYADRLGQSAADALTAAPLLESLTDLNLSGSAGFDAAAADKPGLAGLLRSPRAAGLRRLHLGRRGLTDPELRELLGSPHLTGLAALDLSAHALDNDRLQALANSSRLPGLTTLSLTAGDFDVRWRFPLAGSTRFPRLAALTIDRITFDSEALEEFVGGRLLGQLQRLRWRGPVAPSR